MTDHRPTLREVEAMKRACNLYRALWDLAKATGGQCTDVAWIEAIIQLRQGEDHVAGMGELISSYDMDAMPSDRDVLIARHVLRRVGQAMDKNGDGRNG